MNNNKKIYNTVSIAPFYGTGSSITVKLFCIWAAIVPQIVFLFITKSTGAIAVMFAAIAGVMISELPDFIARKNVNLSIAYGLCAGTLTGFLIPSDFSPVSVFFITVFSMLIVKYVFGGICKSWLNPVVITVAFTWFISNLSFPSFQISMSDLAEKNPSLVFIQNVFSEINPLDERITFFLNDTAFKHFNVSIPSGYVSLFWDNLSVIPAFRFSVLVLAASIFLIASDTEDSLIPLLYIFVYSMLVKFVSPFFVKGVAMQGDILLAILSSGTLYTAFFLLQWPGTLPLTSGGKTIYGIAGGIIAFLFCGSGTSPVGSVMTVLFLNIMTPVIQSFEQGNVKKRLKILVEKEGIN